MDIDLDSGKLFAFVGGLCAFLLLESLLPARTWTGSRLWRLIFHLGVAALNTLTIRLLVFVPLLLFSVYVEEQGWGISRWFGLVGWTELIVSLIVLDLFDYLWHRANHRLRFLWRFHKAHHSDSEMDVTTALRFHPGELLLSAGVKALWLVIWGPTVIAWFVFEVMISFCAQFHHSNIDFPDSIERWLSRIVVTPRYHTAHHAVKRGWGDANFATIFSVWDRVFRSYAQAPSGPAATQALGALGLPEGRAYAGSPWSLLLEPIRSRNLSLARGGADPASTQVTTGSNGEN